MKIDKLATELISAGKKKVVINRLSTFCLSLSVFLLSLALFFILDYLTFFPSLVRALISFLIFFSTLFYIPWRRRDILKTNEDLISLAKEAETLAELANKSGFSSTLISAVEFSLNPAIPGLKEFKAMTISKAHNPEFLPSRLVFYDQKTKRKAIIMASAVLVIYSVLLYFLANEFGIFAKRAIGFNIKYPSKTKIVYIDYQKKSEQNKDLEVNIKVDGLIPSSGKTQIAFVGENSFKIPLENLSEKGLFKFSVKAPLKSFQFRILIGDAVSDWEKVSVIPSPVIKEAVIKIFPPEYTKISVSKSDIRDLEVIEKSLLSFSILPDRDLRKCLIEIKDFKDGGTKEHVMEKRADGKFEYPKLLIKDSCSYSIRLIDHDNIENSNRIVYNIKVLPDNLPIIHVEKPPDAGYFSNISKMRWSLTVSDDYGIEDIFMSYKIITLGEGGEQKIQKKGVIPLIKADSRLFLSKEGIINLSDLKLSIGVILSIQFEARDSSPFREQGQTGKSKIINLNIVSPAELKNLINSELLMVEKMVEDIQSDIKKQINVINLYKKQEMQR